MPVVIDGRSMIPPEPLERTLQAVQDLRDGDTLTLLVYCHPQPLLFILEDEGYQWRETLRSDGTHELTISRPPTA